MIKREKCTIKKNGWYEDEEITEYVIEIMKRYEIEPISDNFTGVFLSDRYTKSLGNVHYKKDNNTGKIIEQCICLSSEMFDEVKEEAVKSVIKHEVAHLEYLNHGKKFKKLCDKMGCYGTHTFKTYWDYEKNGE